MDFSRISQYEDCGAWEYCRQMKKEGKIRHLGFSFHDTADVLDKILDLYPETEFVQLQINYADWDDPEVQSRKCYEVCRKHNTPVVIMEPVKGGSLANMHPDVQQVFQAADPSASNASWAIRFCASLEGIITVLSGMSNMEQLTDNVSYMENFQPLSDDERKVLDHAVEVLKSIPTIPCTACKYCVDGCPQNINIPGIFSAFNHYKMYNNLSDAKRRYNDAVKDGGKASDCIKCLACESQCPQHIEITKQLEEAAELFE